MKAEWIASFLVGFVVSFTVCSGWSLFPRFRNQRIARRYGDIREGIVVARFSYALVRTKLTRWEASELKPNVTDCPSVKAELAYLNEWENCVRRDAEYKEFSFDSDVD